MAFVIAHNLVEENGKTVRENNMELVHAIPLKVLVEVDLECTDNHRTRLYVCEHTRDCDGTPLYSLSASRDIDMTNPYERIKAETGFPEYCLTVIDVKR